ncbi:MAG: glycosyltransferase [Candidatus Harrisonbacteria bacterium]|nr:glycosyltransferase [Candidatus Harrisonbacteria bacterium]
MKQKVLYIITKADIGGAQKYVNDLSTGIDKNVFEPKILYGGRDIHWLIRDAKPWLFFLPDWLAIIELIKIYKRERPQIIHLNSSKAGFLGSIAAKLYSLTLRPTTYDLRPKIIFTAHGWVFNPTNAISLPIRWFYILLHKIAALFQDKIICVSEYDYNLALSRGITPKEKLVTIYNGIDPNIKFLDKETAKNEITKKLTTYDLRLTTNWPWIGSIGRLVKEKNYETLLAAAKFIPNAYFFIIGSGPESNSLKVKSQNSNVNNRFFFIEPTGNDAQYLKAFDIFVMSSIKEGLPYILLEAMAAELPIVITEAGGMPEIIKNHENGLMVSQKNPEMLAKGIQGLLFNKNIAAELGKSAGLIVREKFGLNKMISETSSLYFDI